MDTLISSRSQVNVASLGMVPRLFGACSVAAILPPLSPKPWSAGTVITRLPPALHLDCFVALHQCNFIATDLFCMTSLCWVAEDHSSSCAIGTAIAMYLTSCAKLSELIQQQTGCDPLPIFTNTEAAFNTGFSTQGNGSSTDHVQHEQSQTSDKVIPKTRTNVQLLALLCSC